jgi:hypothetical protein
MSDRPFADAGDDLHVRVAVETEAGPRRDLVVVPDDQRTQGSVHRIALGTDGELVLVLEPAEVAPSSVREGRTFNSEVPPLQSPLRNVP